MKSLQDPSIGDIKGKQWLNKRKSFKNLLHNYLTKIFFNILAKLNCPNRFNYDFQILPTRKNFNLFISSNLFNEGLYLQIKSY